MNSIAKINIKGEDFALIPWEDYEDLADIAAYNDFQRKLAAGEEEFFPAEIVESILLDGANTAANRLTKRAPLRVFPRITGKNWKRASPSDPLRP